jgi:predicted dehydrogenase
MIDELIDKPVNANGNGPRPNCKVAIVGAGYMSREHIRAFQNVPGVQVAGIHSRTRSRAEALAQEFHLPEVCNSIAELFTKTAANLVVVSVPEPSANEVCLACFEHPWTALIEKPVGYTVAYAEAIAATARAKGRHAFVALNRRHYGSTRAVVADLATQPGPRLIKLQDQQEPIALRRTGGFPPEVLDNLMYANSIHVIDYFSLLARGAVIEVTPVIRWNSQPSQLPRYVAARISFDSGDVGLYEAIWDGPGPWAVSVNTPQKRWEMRPLEKAAFQLPGKRVLEPIADDAWDTLFKPGLRRQAELAVLAASGQPTELPTLQDALATMRLTQAIYA